MDLTDSRPHCCLLTYVSKQDRQCACNVSLRCVRETIVTVEKQWVLLNLCVCVCSLRYPEYNSHAPYCHLWPAKLYNIFPHYLTNGTIFEKQLLNIKCVFLFSLQLLYVTLFIFWEMLLKMYIGLHICTFYSRSILMKLEFPWQIFEKYSDIKSHEYPSTGSRVVPFV
jgi:hypothetical protein